ncbi:hypothetical protein K9L05_03730 [Candidatus Babeliales bacterium]|nr:hypothetical protein [Candidatus Babeliales bacterium]MCF7899728.1 hypothetical protein [Candidatus Babeliales bacterium]
MQIEKENMNLEEMDDIEKKREEQIKDLTKKLEYQDIDSELRIRVNLLIKDYQNLVNELEAKKNSCISNENLWVESLKKLYNLAENEDLPKEDLDNSEKYFKRYYSLLEETQKACVAELDFFNNLVSPEHFKDITVVKDAPDSFLEIIKIKVKNSRNFLNRTLKDLRVSFSRLQLDYNNKLRNLKMMEYYLKAQKEHAQKHKVEHEHKHDHENCIECDHEHKE